MACRQCSSPATLKCANKCIDAIYCSKKCGNLDWKQRHAKECATLIGCSHCGKKTKNPIQCENKIHCIHAYCGKECAEKQFKYHQKICNSFSLINGKDDEENVVAVPKRDRSDDEEEEGEDKRAKTKEEETFIFFQGSHGITVPVNEKRALQLSETIAAWKKSPLTNNGTIYKFHDEDASPIPFCVWHIFSIQRRASLCYLDQINRA